MAHRTEKNHLLARMLIYCKGYKQPDAKIHRAQAGRVPSPGAPVPPESGVHHPPSQGCVLVHQPGDSSNRLPAPLNDLVFLVTSPILRLKGPHPKAPHEHKPQRAQRGCFVTNRTHPITGNFKGFRSSLPGIGGKTQIYVIIS